MASRFFQPGKDGSAAAESAAMSPARTIKLMLAQRSSAEGSCSELPMLFFAQVTFSKQKWEGLLLIKKKSPINSPSVLFTCLLQRGF
ncbi:unnamed protein product [Heligmosomoides polygyrus]|uniref:Uncharacterized protein n=1 Tax=Heligmosomoides polygyrus TaxID=6339 RepID=A0A183GDW7_HELPZ|nr:unnamed protein product [Heligmosomoides polygyrus]